MQRTLPVIVVLLVTLGVTLFLFNPLASRESEVASPISKVTDTSAISLPQDGLILSAPIDTSLPPAVALARLSLVGRLGMTDAKSIAILTADETDWSDGCLGLTAPNEFCTQVITPGYRVVMQTGEHTYIYRTNETGSSIRFEGERQ